MKARYFIRHISDMDSLIQYIKVMGGMIYILNFNEEWNSICPEYGISFDELERSDFNMNNISKELIRTYYDKVTVEITEDEFKAAISKLTNKDPNDYWLNSEYCEIWQGILEFLEFECMTSEFQGVYSSGYHLHSDTFQVEIYIDGELDDEDSYIRVKVNQENSLNKNFKDHLIRRLEGNVPHLKMTVHNKIRSAK